jgi:L-ascorbate metabolism protein UlaG (beta-lactamase superfamily)
MPTGSALIDHMNHLTVIPNSLGIYGLGQMGFALKGPEGVIVIDACLSDVIRERFGDWWSRAYPPPVEPEAVTNVIAYGITHEHMDHLDPVTVAAVGKASPGARFISPGWCSAILTEECGVEPGRQIIPTALVPMPIPGTSARLTAIPSAHYAKEYDEQQGYRWLGYLIEWNGVRLYHAGDTIIHKGYVDTLKGLPTADVAIIPVNGRDWYREDVIGAVGNLHPAEAAWLTQECGWGVVIPGHNDLFPRNAIPQGEILQAFATASPRQPLKWVQPGELYYVVKP